MPSSVINAGHPPTDPPSPAWTLASAPLPFAPRAEWGQPDPPDAQDAIILVEQIHGPVLLLCAGQDRVSPANNPHTRRPRWFLVH